MAKACDEHHNLINQLPESYVGKSEHLSSILRVISSAAKRSMKEKNIPMGPWQKHEMVRFYLAEMVFGPVLA
ncbi:Protein of unknown function DUF506 [Macleaya cordata]|uniref:Uncharacterized protein n=1 Tax=Macleaya cordata TaxID=56857 RepID=A0A200QV88_MACCD|nr:Protein of unknown function DUF506 [Macleaya cordata]